VRGPSRFATTARNVEGMRRTASLLAPRTLALGLLVAASSLACAQGSNLTSVLDDGSGGSSSTDDGGSGASDGSGGIPNQNGTTSSGEFSSTTSNGPSSSTTGGPSSTTSGGPSSTTSSGPSSTTSSGPSSTTSATTGSGGGNTPCDPLNPGPECGGGMQCVPLPAGDPVCEPAGSGGPYALCASRAQCAPSLECVNDGLDACCMSWCRVGFPSDCSSFETCEPLNNPPMINGVEYGVCWDGYPCVF
jgi:hypothetical protein